MGTGIRKVTRLSKVPLESCQVDRRRTNFIFKTSGLPFTDATFVLWIAFRDVSLEERYIKKLLGERGRRGAGGTGSSSGLSKSDSVLHLIKCRTNALVGFT